MSVEPWQATAFNPATESNNQIHSDEMAKAYGFRGGLVPGVTISSYLMHPAVLAWGEDWLTREQLTLRCCILSMTALSLPSTFSRHRIPAARSN